MSVYVGRLGDPSPATEIPLFEQAQCGCQVSLNQLMRRHDGLVQAIVRQQYLGTLPFVEALQAGRIGLWRAILGYDAHRGLAFSTYAWPAIMRHVWRAVKNDGREESICAAGLVLSAGHSDDPVAVVEATALREALHRLVQRLPQRLQQVVVSYYGLDGNAASSYRRLGARLGLSHERIHQLHTAALVWLRHPAHSQALRTLLQRHSVADYEAADALAQRWLQKRAGRHGR